MSQKAAPPLTPPVLAAAARLVAVQGAEGFTMDELARAAKISRATLYRQARSREAVLDALSAAGADVGERIDTRRRILTAARAVFCSVGFDAATIDEIATEAAVGLATVYRHFGDKDGLVAAFLGDHGGPNLIERLQGKREGEGKNATRIKLGNLQKPEQGGLLPAAEEAAQKRTGGKPLNGSGWVAYADDHMLWLSTAGVLDSRRGEALDAIVQAVTKMPEMEFAIRVDAFNKDCSGLLPMETLVCRSVYLDRAGDIYWVPRKYSVIQKDYNADSHGTPHDYDREVPLILREPGKLPREVKDEIPSMLRVAPTLARMLHQSPPSGAREPAL